MDSEDCYSNGSSSEIPNSVQVYTHNITRRPIAWDPARQRPTQELVHAIHSALHFALDPCVNHADEKPSFCVLDRQPFSLAKSSESKLEAATPSRRQLIIPCVNDMARAPPASSIDPSKNKNELTVKLFAGFDDALLTTEVVEEALEALERVYGSAREIERFIISLEGVKCSADSADEVTDSEVRQIAAMRESWEVCIIFWICIRWSRCKRA